MGRRVQQQGRKQVSDSLQAEVQHWQARTDDLQVALERVREERDKLRIDLETLQHGFDTATRELAMFKQMVDRMRIAMSQGAEL
jgi:predicted  nucleic acid-binding Zn-ribbon protein